MNSSESGLNQLLLTIEITSFSFKSPPPSHLFTSEGGRHGGGFVFDCRSLPNPGREARFKLATGRDQEVVAYLEACQEVSEFRTHSYALVESAVRNFLLRGFSFLSVSFGCTGGQHRSVYFAEHLAAHLRHSFGPQVNPVVLHPSLDAKNLLR